MQTRSPTKFIIQKIKEAGGDKIHPSTSIRFISGFLSSMPDHWQGLNREQLIKKVREACEVGASGGLLIRKRDPGVKGYTYHLKEKSG